MSTVQTTAQGVKGSVQQVVGTIEKKLGHPVEGTIDQLKGKANVAVSDLKKEVEDSK